MGKVSVEDDDEVVRDGLGEKSQKVIESRCVTVQGILLPR